MHCEATSAISLNHLLTSTRLKGKSFPHRSQNIDFYNFPEYDPLLTSDILNSSREFTHYGNPTVLIKMIWSAVCVHAHQLCTVHCRCERRRSRCEHLLIHTCDCGYEKKPMKMIHICCREYRIRTTLV